MPLISAVVAMTEDRVIGRDNDLPWRIPEDLAHFKRLTVGKPIIMGRKNHESIGRPLPDRHNIVLTHRRDYRAEGCTVVHSVDEALRAAGEAAEVAVIGGAQVYQTFLPITDRIYLTLIRADIPGDTYFPELDMSQWREQERDDREPGTKRPYPLSYITLDRR